MPLLTPSVIPTVVVGTTVRDTPGTSDNAPMLFNGELVGNGTGAECDFAVDPVDGTTSMATGTANALSVVAVAERGSMFDPSAVFYMDKLVVGPEAADLVDIRLPISANILHVASALGRAPHEMTVAVLDRTRHTDLIAQIRETGAGVRLLSDGDVDAAIAVVRPDSGIDIAAGIGGTPEGVLAAAALRCMGGAIQVRLTPRNDREHAQAIAAGHNLDRVLHTNDLVSGENVFFTATGVTDGALLRGVRYTSTHATTQSLVLRSSSGTVRFIDSKHRLSTTAPKI